MILTERPPFNLEQLKVSILALLGLRRVIPVQVRVGHFAQGIERQLVLVPQDTTPAFRDLGGQLQMLVLAIDDEIDQRQLQHRSQGVGVVLAQRLPSQLQCPLQRADRRFGTAELAINLSDRMVQLPRDHRIILEALIDPLCCRNQDLFVQQPDSRVRHVDPD